MATAVDEIPEQTERPLAQAPVHFLLVLWQRKWLVVLGLVAGLVLGGVVAARAKPLYRSSAQVLVIKKRTDVVPMTGTDPSQPYLEDYMATHITLLKSPVVLEKAIKRGQLTELPTFAGQGNPAGAIASSLTVTRDSTSSYRTVIDLSYQGPVADDTGKILGAVLDGYRDFVGGAYRSVSEETEKLITKARDLLKHDLEVKEQEYQAFREKGPLLWKGKDGANFHQARIAEIEGKRSSLLIRKAEAEGRLKEAEEAKKGGAKHFALVPLPAEPGPRAGAAANDRGAEDQLSALLLQEQELLEDYGEDHPQVRAVRAKIAFQRRLMERRGITDLDRTAPAKTDENGLARYIESLNQELAQIQVSEKSLNGLLAEELEQAKEMSRYEIADEGYRNELTRTQQLCDQTIRRLQEINLVKDFAGYDAEVISPPGPGEKVATSLLRILFLAAGLGLVGGVGLAYLADVTDKSFRTVEEIRRRLALPVMGHIPFNAEARTARAANGRGVTPLEVAPSVWVHHRPSSSEAEAYRGLRTALYFATQGEGHKVIQITSPSKGDGKTTLAANLGVSIAHSGKRVLLVDADFRRPRLDKLFGLTTSAGVPAIIAGEADPGALIQETAVPGLFVLPCGKRPPNPAELLTSPRFENLLAELKDLYDYVLVDTPPLLAVTDPCVVAGRADAVLLGIRVSKHGRPAAERAKEMLTTLGARVLGVVVNGVGRAGDRNGYGYRYYSYYEYKSSEEEETAEANGQPQAR